MPIFSYRNDVMVDTDRCPICGSCECDHEKKSKFIGERTVGYVEFDKCRLCGERFNEVETFL